MRCPSKVTTRFCDDCADKNRKEKNPRSTEKRKYGVLVYCRAPLVTKGSIIFNIVLRSSRWHFSCLRRRLFYRRLIIPCPCYFDKVAAFFSTNTHRQACLLPSLSTSFSSLLLSVSLSYFHFVVPSLLFVSLPSYPSLSCVFLTFSTHHVDRPNLSSLPLAFSHYCFPLPLILLLPFHLVYPLSFSSMFLACFHLLLGLVLPTFCIFLPSLYLSLFSLLFPIFISISYLFVIPRAALRLTELDGEQHKMQ